MKNFIQLSELVNELEKPDKEKIVASALESAEEVIQNDCDKITLNNVDQIAEVKEVTTGQMMSLIICLLMSWLTILILLISKIVSYVKVKKNI